ncbi:putative signal peptide protein [Puccinia sorghi]|uniref:Putative signal peptide protein n=1 Tax=Puccinia sorghi TaxID=27349 RepID=A0A0L6VV38_9BASI|nr:putative signal peptide protein [Puccinia sorghi]
MLKLFFFKVFFTVASLNKLALCVGGSTNKTLQIVVKTSSMHALTPNERVPSREEYRTWAYILLLLIHEVTITQPNHLPEKPTRLSRAAKLSFLDMILVALSLPSNVKSQDNNQIDHWGPKKQDACYYTTFILTHTNTVETFFDLASEVSMRRMWPEPIYYTRLPSLPISITFVDPRTLVSFHLFMSARLSLETNRADWNQSAAHRSVFTLSLESDETVIQHASQQPIQMLYTHVLVYDCPKQPCMEPQSALRIVTLESDEHGHCSQFKTTNTRARQLTLQLERKWPEALSLVRAFQAFMAEPLTLWNMSRIQAQCSAYEVPNRDARPKPHVRGSHLREAERALSFEDSRFQQTAFSMAWDHQRFASRLSRNTHPMRNLSTCTHTSNLLIIMYVHKSSIRAKRPFKVWKLREACKTRTCSYFLEQTRYRLQSVIIIILRAFPHANIYYAQWHKAALFLCLKDTLIKLKYSINKICSGFSNAISHLSELALHSKVFICFWILPTVPWMQRKSSRATRSKEAIFEPPVFFLDTAHHPLQFLSKSEPSVLDLLPSPGVSLGLELPVLSIKKNICTIIEVIWTNVTTPQLIILKGDRDRGFCLALMSLALTLLESSSSSLCGWWCGDRCPPILIIVYLFIYYHILIYIFVAEVLPVGGVVQEKASPEVTRSYQPLFLLPMRYQAGFDFLCLLRKKGTVKVSVASGLTSVFSVCFLVKSTRFHSLMSSSLFFSGRSPLPYPVLSSHPLPSEFTILILLCRYYTSSSSRFTSLPPYLRALILYCRCNWRQVSHPPSARLGAVPQSFSIGKDWLMIFCSPFDRSLGSILGYKSLADLSNKQVGAAVHQIGLVGSCTDLFAQEWFEFRNRDASEIQRLPPELTGDPVVPVVGFSNSLAFCTVSEEFIQQINVHLFQNTTTLPQYSVPVLWFPPACILSIIVDKSRFSTQTHSWDQHSCYYLCSLVLSCLPPVPYYPCPSPIFLTDIDIIFSSDEIPFIFLTFIIVLFFLSLCQKKNNPPRTLRLSSRFPPTHKYTHQARIQPLNRNHHFPIQPPRPFVDSHKFATLILFFLTLPEVLFSYYPLSIPSSPIHPSCQLSNEIGKILAP